MTRTKKTEQGRWQVAYLLSSGNVVVLAGTPVYDAEVTAVAEASRRNREKPFLAHVAIRSEGAIYGRS